MRKIDDPHELYKEGLDAFRRGDQGTSKRLNEKALASAREQQDEINQIRALIGLSRVAFRAGDHGEIERLAAECEPLWEQLEDKTAVTSPFHMLAESHRLHGNFQEARGLYLRNIEDAQAAADQYVVELETINLGLLEVMDANHTEALRLGLEMAEARKQLDDPYLALVLGAARVATGDLLQGVGDLATCSALLEKAGEILDPADQPVFDDAVARAKEALGEEGFKNAWDARYGRD